MTTGRKIQKTVEYELHKWKRQLFVLDKVVILVVIVAFAFFRADYVTLAAYIYSLIHLFITRRVGLLKHLLLSSGMAVAFVFLIRDQYGYNHDYMTIGGLNVFSLFGWAAGLFAFYIVYSHIEHWIKRPNAWKRIGLFVGMYWPTLIIAEWVGYYLFDIQNIATAQYPGLPLCDCMHAPWWMQLGYFAMGPLYIIFSTLLKLENPHSKPKK